MYKQKKKQRGFFDIDWRYEELSKSGDPLEKLNNIINFEKFRYRLNKVLDKPAKALSEVGRPAYDPILMLKVLVIQTLYNLSDEQTEFQLRDRLSFMRFIGVNINDDTPDAKTIWHYRELFGNVMEKIFSIFHQDIKDRGYEARSGQLVDASIICAPKQRLTKAEKEQLKKGEIPQDWTDSQLSQKDLDAKWVVKYKAGKEGKTDIAIPQFGYKNHINIDQKYGFIRNFAVTDASTYDGHKLSEILDLSNSSNYVLADSAYNTKANNDYLESICMKAAMAIKKPKKKEMPSHIKELNHARAKIRSRVEHVFAVLKDKLGIFIRTIGIKRAYTKIALANMVYNMKRLVYWEGRRLSAA